MKYMQEPLIIPTNIFQHGKFSGTANVVGGGGIVSTFSVCLENCDSIFLLIPNNPAGVVDNAQQTTFYQPYLTNVRLQLGEFGIHPGKYVNTWNDDRFVSMVLDSLNLERSDISSMNQDLARSINCNKNSWDLSAAGLAAIENLNDGDRSNFFIGISMSQMGFQSGCMSSPNTNIPFVFNADVVRLPGGTDVAASPPINGQIEVMFLLDAAYIIQVAPNSNVPIVKLTTKSDV
jgi:hypothetical protein